MRIGVFDSGLGGLSVLQEIQQRMPAASLAYVADSAWVPYGPRSQDVIRKRARALSRFLLDHGADIIVVACNTATAAAVPLLRETMKVPIVGMEPAVKPATAATRNGVVGVLATAGTLASTRFAALLDQFGADIQVLTRACPGLVERVEAGDLDSPRTHLLVRQYVQPLVEGGADTLVLGCTHFAFLRPVIEATAGPGVTMIDTGEAVARRVEQVAASLKIGIPRRGGAAFWTSGEAATISAPLRKLWGAPVILADLPGEYAGGSD
ncbi:MAG TPA: glutamate racemase [Gammaproteobacteria bacterium]|nr:glutamate racemase [Gammaproteobacteria bacterium]